MGGQLGGHLHRGRGRGRDYGVCGGEIGKGITFET